MSGAVGRNWGDVLVFAGTQTTLKFSILDANGSAITISGGDTFELWLKNTRTPSDTFRYLNTDFTVISTTVAPQLSVVLQAGDTNPRSRQVYNTQLWKTNVNVSVGYGLLRVLDSARPVSGSPIIDNLPLNITGILAGTGTTIVAATLVGASYDPPSHTLTVSIPDLSGYATLSTAQTLSNKTISSGSLIGAFTAAPDASIVFNTTPPTTGSSIVLSNLGAAMPAYSAIDGDGNSTFLIDGSDGSALGNFFGFNADASYTATYGTQATGAIFPRYDLGPTTGGSLLSLVLPGGGNALMVWTDFTNFQSTLTLAAPGTISGTFVATLPRATGTVVLDTATQTLSNKTLASPTFTGIAIGSVASFSGNISASSFVGNLPANELVGATLPATLLSSSLTVVGTLQSPTMVTPTLGVAAVTSVNKVTITAPATTATLGLANNSSLNTSGAFSLTITCTGTTTVTMPTTGTLAVVSGNLGTPTTLVGTNISGTASGLTVGTANAAPASGLTGTTLAATIVVSSLTSVGTLTSLTVDGTGGISILQTGGTPGTNSAKITQAGGNTTIKNQDAGILILSAPSNQAIFFFDNGGQDWGNFKLGSGPSLNIGPSGGNDAKLSFQGINLINSAVVSWASGGGVSSGADTALARNAGGIVEVNNGTAGTYRDLRLRTIFSEATQTIVAGGTSGSVTFSQPFQGVSYKRVAAYVNALFAGNTAAYTFSSAFTNTPDIQGGKLALASTSATVLTITGNGTSGWVFLEGY